MNYWFFTVGTGISFEHAKKNVKRFFQVKARSFEEAFNIILSRINDFDWVVSFGKESI